jgi:hypothetical protein
MTVALLAEHVRTQMTPNAALDDSSFTNSAHWRMDACTPLLILPSGLAPVKPGGLGPVDHRLCAAFTGSNIQAPAFPLVGVRRWAESN